MDDTDKDHDLSERKFYPAEEEAKFSKAQPESTPQTEHPAYKLAFQDREFLLREELRPVRFQLELLKTEMLLDEAGVGSTLVMYGSARIPPPESAQVARTCEMLAVTSIERESAGPAGPNRVMSPVPAGTPATGQASRTE